MILHYFKLLPYNVVSSWHSGGMIGTQWTMRSNQSEHAENQRKTMFSSKGPLDTPFHHLLLLETNEHKFVPDLLIMCTTERITSVLHWLCALRLFTMFSGDENFIVPESSLVLPRWPKTQKTLGTRLSMTSMCTIGQWGVCYA